MLDHARALCNASIGDRLQQTSTQNHACLEIPHRSKHSGRNRAILRTRATPPDTTSGGFTSVAVPQRTGEYASGPLGHESHHLRHLAAFRDESAMNKGGWRISGERAKMLLRQQQPT
jgi:hypothetical protein